MKQSSQGFTFVELILVIAVIAILAGLTLPVYLSFQNRQELDITATQVAQTLRRAQTLAQASRGDSAWGVYIQDTDLILYQGPDYGSRDLNFDEAYQIPNTVTVSGLPLDIVFAKFTGELTLATSVTLISSNGQSKKITINEKGAVSY